MLLAYPSTNERILVYVPTLPLEIAKFVQKFGTPSKNGWWHLHWETALEMGIVQILSAIDSKRIVQ